MGKIMPCIINLEIINKKLDTIQNTIGNIVDMYEKQIGTQKKNFVVRSHYEWNTWYSNLNHELVISPV